MDKLFIVTRSDLPLRDVAPQSVHAAFAFAHEHHFEWRTWFLGSNNIVLLATKDEASLEQLAARARAANVPVSLFREPDFGDSVTGIAIGPQGWKLVSSLPLALKPPKAA